MQMKSVAAMLLVAGCGCAQADVYKWTDERGQAQFGERPPAGVEAEKVMTQQQIERDESAAPASPPPGASEGADAIHQAVQERQEECQRYKSMRADLIRDAAASNGPDWTPLMGYSAGYIVHDERQNSNRILDYSAIEANIRKYCQD
jgi:hypothetical protein